MAVNGSHGDEHAVRRGAPRKPLSDARVQGEGKAVVRGRGRGGSVRIIKTASYRIDTEVY